MYMLTYKEIQIAAMAFDTLRNYALTEGFDPEDEPFSKIKQLNNPVETYCVCL